jgi:hypothetical protein
MNNWYGNNWDGMVVMAMASTIGTETIGWNGGFGWNNWMNIGAGTTGVGMVLDGITVWQQLGLAMGIFK